MTPEETRALRDKLIENAVEKRTRERLGRLVSYLRASFPKFIEPGMAPCLNCGKITSRVYVDIYMSKGETSMGMGPLFDTWGPLCSDECKAALPPVAIG